MPAWTGKWKGGRYYLDDQGRPVYFIERRRRSIKLQTHDLDLAMGELARFLNDPVAFVRPAAVAAGLPDPVFITKERVTLYLESIRGTVKDHRAARRSYLLGWSKLRLDLRTVDRRSLRIALASFDGGHNGRTEALNAFARFLVREGDLPAWNPLVNHRASKETRAPREAYTVEQLTETFHRLTDQAVKDLFYVRAATGMHHTEIAQLVKAPVISGPLPERGVGIRKLGGKHEIQGVLQVMHKSRRRHRQSVSAPVLRAALRLREGVPHRVAVWKALAPLVPSNLRHTFVTLAGEVGTLVTFVSAGVERARIAQVVGHRQGSTMTADVYDKQQVPPMIRLPLEWDVA